MNKQNLISIEFWIKGLIAAFIGGGATIVSSMVIAPDTFNIHDLKKLGQLAVASGIINACMYLKQSPIPNIEIQTTNETKPTTTVTTPQPPAV